MRLLAFSDLHRDLEQAARLVARSEDADVVVCAGDLASVHEGLEETVEALRPISKPTVLVPGNNETEEALRAACAGWTQATVLHGNGCELDGVSFFGLGGGIPVTPWEWSYDLGEQEAARALEGCPAGAVLVVHSPPRGHADESKGESLGSEAIRDAIASHEPQVAVCGHIHDCWGVESRLGPTRILNLGPEGTLIEL